MTEQWIRVLAMNIRQTRRRLVVGVAVGVFCPSVRVEIGGDECRAKKIGGRHRARVATSPQVQNRMVEILRMCTFDISNLDTATAFITQVIAG